MRDDLAPILVCVRAANGQPTHGTCALCDAPVVLWDGPLPERRVLICVLCFLVHAEPGTPWTQHALVAKC